MTRNDIREKASKWLGTISTPPSEKMYLKDYMLDGMESFGLEIANSVAEECAKELEMVGSEPEATLIRKISAELKGDE